MTIVGRNFTEMKEELKLIGYEVVCPDFFLEHDRIICEKDDHNFPLQYLPFYNYRFIVKLYNELGYPPPADCQKAYDQQRSTFKK